MLTALNCAKNTSYTYKIEKKFARTFLVGFSALHGKPARTSDEKGSVRLSNAWIVTQREKDLSKFLYHTKDHIAYFSEKKNGWWGRPLLSEILGQPAPVGAKSLILNRCS